MVYSSLTETLIAKIRRGGTGANPGTHTALISDESYHVCVCVCVDPAGAEPARGPARALCPGSGVRQRVGHRPERQPARHQPIRSPDPGPGQYL